MNRVKYGRVVNQIHMSQRARDLMEKNVSENYDAYVAMGEAGRSEDDE